MPEVVASNSAADELRADGTVRARAIPLLHRIVRHAGVLLAGDVATRLLLFGTTVYLARTLGTPGLGLLAFTQVLYAFLVLVADWGLGIYGVREVARFPADRRHVWIEVTSLRTGLGTVACLIAIGLVVLSGWDSLTKWVVALMLLGAVPLAAMPDWMFRGMERMRHAAALNALFPALTLLGLFLTVRQPSDIVAVPVVRLVAAVATTLTGHVLVLRTRELQAQSAGHLRLLPDLGAAWPALRMGTVLLATNLAVLAHSSIDVVLMRVFIDDRAVGLYSAAYRIIQLPMGAFYALTAAALPVLARQAGGRDGDDQVRSALMRFGAVAGIAVGLIVWSLRAEIIRLSYGEAFAPSAAILAVLAFAIPLDFAVAVKGTSYIARGLERHVLLCVAGAASVNVAANLILIPRLGPIGAAGATLISYTMLLMSYVAYLDRRGHR